MNKEYIKFKSIEYGEKIKKELLNNPNNVSCRNKVVKKYIESTGVIVLMDNTSTIFDRNCNIIDLDL